MTRPRDVDWETLGALWREQGPDHVVPGGLADRVRRHTRFMWLTVATELGLFAGLGAVSWWYLSGRVTAVRVGVLGMVWLVNIGIEVFSVWNRRGSWRAAAETTAAYVELIHRRALAKLRAARFVRFAALLQSAAVVTVVWVDTTRSGSDAAARMRLAVGMAAGFIAIYIAWAAWYERRARAELREASAARALLAEGNEM